jgi:drug/metabolite transporter (DMT)-like permease
MTGKPNPTLELLLLALLATLWGSSYTMMRIAVPTIPPVTLIATRTLIAAALLGLILWRRGLDLPRDRAIWGRFLIQACLNSAVPFTLIAWAERSVEAGAAAILNATTPLFAFVLAALVLRQEKVTALKIAGLAAGLAGCGLVVGVDTVANLGRDLLPQGAVLLASACYAGAAVFGRTFRELDPMVPATGSLICGALLLCPLSLVVDRPWTAAPTPAAFAATASLAVLSTAVAFVLYFRLVQTLGAVGATAQAYLRAPIGVGIGVALIGEVPTPTLWLGLACVVAGVMAMTWPARRRGAVAVNAARPST